MVSYSLVKIGCYRDSGSGDIMAVAGHVTYLDQKVLWLYREVI